jgi:shikimate dehydrogenase
MRKFGLIGYPLSHSFSVGFFAKKFSDEQITDAMYQNYPLESIDEFTGLIDSTPDLAGLNVTIPYKQKIIPFLSDLDETAQKVGAVNTIKFERNQGILRLIGYNTDVYGFEESLKPHLGKGHKKALVLGTGGASKAVIYVLEKLNIMVDVISRNPADDVYKTYEELTSEDMMDHKIIVNTTPLGMYPKLDQMPEIPYNRLTSEHLLFDLIYNPLETAFLTEGVKKGAKAINGLKMLHLQAVKAWEIWNR